jgi:putative transposase
MLEQKSKEYGTTIHKIDRFYPSSKTCSNCGEKKATLSLGEREYRCEFCGNVIDRDLNASINIRNQTCKDLSLEYDDYKHGEIIRPNYHYSGYFYEVLRNFNNDRNNVC